MSDTIDVNEVIYDKELQRDNELHAAVRGGSM